MGVIMKYGLKIMLIFCLMCTVLASESLSEGDASKIARGEVQSCSGCSLRHLTDVKRFIFDDLPKYHGVEFHQISGAIPELVLFDHSDKELQRTSLSELSRKECNELVSKWFKLKKDQGSREENKGDL